MENQEEKYKYLSDADYYVMIGNTKLGFSKIRNISLHHNPESIEEGEEDIALSAAPESKMKETLILEKAYALDMNKVIAEKLVPGVEVRNVSLMLMTADKQVRKEFFMERGIVTKRSFSDLNAASGNLLILTLEIAHAGLEEE